MSDLILIRGLPGSGKSTLAKSLGTHFHLETDMWFEFADGYRFDASKLPQHHASCQHMCASMLKSRNVVVSNTFTQLWEMEPYFKMGANKVTIITCEGTYGNVHGVPADKVAQMRARWEPVTQVWLESMKGR